MTKVAIRNNRQAPYGVEKVGGGYVFVAPGKTRVVDAAHIPAIEADGVPFEIVAELPAPPQSLVDKVAHEARLLETMREHGMDDVRTLPDGGASPDPLDHDGDGRPGGSRKGAQSTRAKGARRQRRKAPTR